MLKKSPVIELENVCFSYRKREVLHNISFSTNQTDMMAIVGPNGGGKSTLLHLILGLLKPLHGSVSLLGDSPRKTRHRVGYIPQNLAFDPKFPVSAMDVVKMGISKGKNKDKLIRANDALKQTGCEDLASNLFSSLSGGERQRVMIANALAGDPELLLLDEPTANVDPKSEHELYQLFKTLNQEIPIVFVSHNLNVVSRHVSHVLCVNHTADAHPMDEVLGSTFTELYGGELAVISHDLNCHVTDASHSLNTPHHCTGCSNHDAHPIHATNEELS